MLNRLTNDKFTSTKIANIILEYMIYCLMDKLKLILGGNKITIYTNDISKYCCLLLFIMCLKEYRYVIIKRNVALYINLILNYKTVDVNCGLRRIHHIGYKHKQLNK